MHMCVSCNGRSTPGEDPEHEGEDFERRKEEVDESWAFWEEQKNPTPGLGNLPRAAWRCILKADECSFPFYIMLIVLLYQNCI